MDTQIIMYFTLTSLLSTVKHTRRLSNYNHSIFSPLLAIAENLVGAAFMLMRIIIIIYSIMSCMSSCHA